MKPIAAQGHRKVVFAALLRTCLRKEGQLLQKPTIFFVGLGLQALFVVKCQL